MVCVNDKDTSRVSIFNALSHKFCNLSIACFNEVHSFKHFTLRSLFIKIKNSFQALLYIDWIHNICETLQCGKQGYKGNEIQYSWLYNLLDLITGGP